MNINQYNILSVGVGGQGVIKITQFLASAALIDNYHVRTAETHGMAQRGGSVSGYLRFGELVNGPLIPAGFADFIVALEPLEAVRNIKYAGKNSIILLNTKHILPLSIYQSKKIVYPEFDEIMENLKKITKNVFFIKATDLAEKAGNVKTSNVVMLGVMLGTGNLPLSKENLEKSILKNIPAKAKEVNEIAFKLGIEEGQKIGSEIN